MNISNLEKAQQIAKIGNWELDYIEDKLTWSNEIYNILEINPISYTPSYETLFQFAHPEDWKMVKNVFETSKKEKKDYYLKDMKNKPYENNNINDDINNKTNKIYTTLETLEEKIEKINNKIITGYIFYILLFALEVINIHDEEN